MMQLSDNQAEDHTTAHVNTLPLSYEGLSVYALHSSSDGSTEQRLSLFTDQRRNSGQVTIHVHDPLPLREGLRTLLEMNGLRSGYVPEDPEVYEAYAQWRRSIDPQLTPIELTQAFFTFLSKHDPETWIGCDPTVTLDEAGLCFELLDPSGRVYGALSLPASGYDLISQSHPSANTPSQVTPVCAQFEGGVTLRESLSLINGSSGLTLTLGADPKTVDESYRGSIEKHLPAPLNWQRNFTQLLAASTLSPRRIPLSRMDLYNILQQLRLNADVPKQKKGMRFELIPGKPPEVTLEPWGWRLTGSGGVYRGEFK